MRSRVRFRVLFLTALLTLRVLIVPAIFLDFQLRKDYIARYLCENRNRPLLNCDGKCYLAKRLNAAQEQEQSQKGQELMRFLFELPFVAPSPPLEFNPVRFAAKIHFPKYLVPISDGRLSTLFHPPQRA
ncbi:MAG: hypothetical protein LH606_05820 [Cytophagaceae bacterium]|nr:hypothetical protein [Cytophagaceae bacterium]